MVIFKIKQFNDLKLFLWVYFFLVLCVVFSLSNFKLFQSISFCLYLCRAWVPSWQMSSYNNSSGCKKQQHIAHKNIRSQSGWFWAFQTTWNWKRNYTYTYYHSCERHSWLPWSRVRIMSKIFIKMVFLNFIKQTIFFQWQKQQISCVQIWRIWNAYKQKRCVFICNCVDGDSNRSNSSPHCR